MEQYEMSDKQPKKRSKAGIVLLMILLILIGAAGYLYYTVVKAPLALDDPEQMAASADMTPEERFRFSAADRTAQIRMDAGDLWYLILEHTGADFLDTINRELKSYNLSVSGCAIRMDEEGVQLNLELYYKETRLVAKVPCALEATGKHMSLTPTAVKLGVIPLPVEGLLSSLKLEYDVSLPVISEVTRVDFVQDAILLTGSMEQDIRTLVSVDEKLYQAAVFSDSKQNIVDTLLAEDGFSAIVSHLEQEPGNVEKLYRELFVLADSDVAADYLDSRNGLTERFFPGIDFAAVEEEHTVLTEEMKARTLLLEAFFTNLSGNYSEKKFKLADGEFLMKKKPFRAAEYGKGKYEELFRILDPESIFLILVDAEDGFIRNTSSFYRMADEDLEFTQEVDYNKTYILGCVLRSVDGEPFLMYDAEIDHGNTYSRVITLRPLTEETVSALQVPGKFGVWTG